MARPEIINDLSIEQRRGHPFCTITPKYLFGLTIESRNKFLGLIDEFALGRSDVTVHGDTAAGEEIVFHAPKSQNNLQSLLEEEQDRWDWAQRRYQDLKEGKTQGSTWEQYSLDKWADAEGLARLDSDCFVKEFE